MGVEVGTLVGDRYRITSRIATGGMGEVWAADDVVLGRTVALKLLRTELAADPAARDRFMAEARHAAGLNHPGIAQVHDFGDAALSDGLSHPYLVMELVPGQPLSDWLRGGRTLPADDAAHLLAQAADAVGFAHAHGVVHRDLKPANLLVTPDGTVKVTDFGIAKALGSAPVTGTGLVLGSAHYLSPEQAAGHPVTPASDLYSLGVVLYEALSGRRPFDRETPIATALAHVRDTPDPLPGDVPPALRATVERAMAKDPADRQPDAAALAAQLRRPGATPTRTLPAAGVAAPVTAPATTATTPTTAASARPWWRRPVPLALAVLAAILVLGGAALAFSQLSGTDPSADATATDGETGAAADPSTGTGDEPTEPSTEPTTEPTTTAAPDTVEVVAADYLLQEKSVVEQQLATLGLGADEAGLDDDTVLADDDLSALAQQVDPDIDEAVLTVEPTGPVPADSTIVLGVWKVSDLDETGAPQETGPPGHGNGNSGNGNSGNGNSGNGNSGNGNSGNGNSGGGEGGGGDRVAATPTRNEGTR